jgi:hypothetical protein
MNYCEDCGQDEPTELSHCTYCGQTYCYDCLSEHEDECEDGDE